MQGTENVYGINMAINPSFEQWSIGAGAVTASGPIADGWDLVEGAGSTISVIKDVTHQASGAACIAATYSVHAVLSTIAQVLPSRMLPFAKGKPLSVRFECNVPILDMLRAWISTDGGASKTYGQLNRVEDKYGSVWVEGIPIPSGATSVLYGVEFVKASPDPVYIDNCTLVFGGAAEFFVNTLTIQDLVDNSGLGFQAGAPTLFEPISSTMDATDIGYWHTSTLDGIVHTLPAFVAGATYKFMNLANDGAASVAISPAAADAILGPGITGAVNKDLILTKATSKRGDYVVLVAGAAVGSAWNVVDMRGIWVREA